MADSSEEAAKKQLAADREAQEKRVADADERQKGTPTPTQEENDLAKLGLSVQDKEDDGSGPERRPGESRGDAESRVKREGSAIEKKEQKPGTQQTPGGTYQTRATTPKPQEK